MQASIDKTFFLSCDVDLPVRIKIENLDDERPKHRYAQRLETELATDEFSEARRLSGLLHTQDCEYYVTCQLFAGNGSPISLPTRTKQTSFSATVKWHEWLTLPIAYSDIPVDTVVVKYAKPYTRAVFSRRTYVAGGLSIANMSSKAGSQ